MSMAEFFVVQSFSPAKRGNLKPDIPVQANSILQARRMAERIAAYKPMVIATVTEGDPETGDFGEPKLIFAHGDNLPEEISDMQLV
jgi:hypothetical protein